MWGEAREGGVWWGGGVWRGGMSEGFGRFLLALSIRDCPSSQVKLLGAPRRYGSLQSIMAENRSEGRTVHIYDHRNPSEVLGDLILTNGVTNKNLYSMCESVHRKLSLFIYAM